MKLRLSTYLIFLVIIPLGVTGCFLPAPAPTPYPPNTGPTVRVECGEFGSGGRVSRQVSVQQGDVLTLTLCTNASTGYQWPENAEIQRNYVLQQMSHRFERPTSNAAGAPGYQIWTFHVIGSGSTRVALDYKRPWEENTVPQWQFDLNVVIGNQQSNPEPVAGGYMRQDPNRAEYQAVKMEGEKLLNYKYPGESIRLNSITELSTQVVAGLNYRMTVQYSNSATRGNLHLTLYRNLQGRFSLTADDYQSIAPPSPPSGLR